jgi:putative oxidoreductase
MHAEHSLITILGHVLIAILYLYRGFENLFRFDYHVEHLKEFNIPLPRVNMVFGLAMMLAGGVMVLVDFHAWIGAILLIVFTIAATLLHHHFWAMEDGNERKRHRNEFFANTAVIGGLLLMIG